MSKILFEPASPTFNELLGNGKILVVPKYQRDYSWDYEEWDDLWNDIVGIPEEGVHYMGYVVLQRTEDSRRFIIIDGQQRITTLTILTLSIIGLLEEWVEDGIAKEENRERIDLIRKQFVGTKPLSSLTLISKLHLNRNNDDFFKSFLLRLRKPASIVKLKPSEKKMWKAFVFFGEKLKERFGVEKKGEVISDFLEKTISDKLVFSSITVGDDLNAYKVFETLNARGVKLSTGDLVKNYLFAEVAKTSEHDLDEAERQWQNINDALQKQDLPTFLRHYWNSIYPLQTKTTLFKAIKNKIQGSESVFALLKDLEDIAPVYVAFGDSGNDLWNKEQSALIEELSLFGVSQCYILLIAAYKYIKSRDENEFNKILRDLIVVIFRYNKISQLNPNTLESEFNNTAILISQKSLTTSREVFLNYSKTIYLADEIFENNFKYKSINTNANKVFVRYLLCKLERQLSGIPVYWNDNKVTIEHILPENASDDWELYFNSEQQQESIFRLGNLTLLETGKNKDCGTKLFNIKRNIYETSQYHLTKIETSYTEWTPNTLQKRQEKMSFLAKTVWKVQY